MGSVFFSQSHLYFQVPLFFHTPPRVRGEFCAPPCNFHSMSFCFVSLFFFKLSPSFLLSFRNDHVIPPYSATPGDRTGHQRALPPPPLYSSLPRDPHLFDDCPPPPVSPVRDIFSYSPLLPNLCRWKTFSRQTTHLLPPTFFPPSPSPPISFRLGPFCFLQEAPRGLYPPFAPSPTPHLSGTFSFLFFTTQSQFFPPCFTFLFISTENLTNVSRLTLSDTFPFFFRFLPSGHHFSPHAPRFFVASLFPTTLHATALSPTFIIFWFPHTYRPSPVGPRVSFSVPHNLARPGQNPTRAVLFL